MQCQGQFRTTPTTLDKNGKFVCDEAVRETVAQPFVCIALVGGSNRHVDDVYSKVVSLKKKLEPDRDPVSWRFHMTDIHSGQKRQSHRIFSSWTRDKCEEALKDLFRVIAGSDDSLFVFALVYPMSAAASMIATKRKAYMAILCDTIYNFTQLVARELYCWQTGRYSEYMSSQLGKVYYSWPDAGDYARDRTVGVPKDRMFPSIASNLLRD